MGRMKRKTGAVATIVAVALAMIALPAAASTASTSVATAWSASAFPPQRRTRVLVLGDSVMAGAASQYGPALPGRDVTVDAMVNRTTGQGAAVLAQRGADWDVVVVMLGHNDGGSPGIYQPAANRILDQLITVPRVVWLSLHEVRPYYRNVNSFLRAQAAHRPSLRIADWNAVANAHPEGLAGDGLHLNGRGASLMAGLVADQVQLAEREVATSSDVAQAASRRAAGEAALFRAKADHDAAQTKLLETIAQDNARVDLLEAIAANMARQRAGAEAEAAKEARVAEQRAAERRAATASIGPTEPAVRSRSGQSQAATGRNDVAVQQSAEGSAGGNRRLPIIALIGAGLTATTTAAALLLRHRRGNRTGG